LYPENMMKPKIVVSLFDESGNMVRPWAEVGYRCFCFDIINKDEDRDGIHFMGVDLRDESVVSQIQKLKPDIVFGFPPCTDLAVSGARHFAEKERKDPLVFQKAMDLVMVVPEIGKDCPWMFENPVSIISTRYRQPNFMFDPYEFGGYLPEDDVHPVYPEYFKSRDAYNKRTCIWTGNNFKKPKKKPVDKPEGYSTTFYKLGGKSAKTKRIRSTTPRGFALAVFEANHGET
jgi:hypothetical protein